MRIVMLDFICKGSAELKGRESNEIFKMKIYFSTGNEDGVAQYVVHWTAYLATRVRSPVGEEPSDLICAFLHLQMESNWAGLSVCNCRYTGK